ncbi:beta-galactosidase [Paenibacillus sp. 598K]|uniref:beta-galactosidase trimerization domain-containing protein n=1 Tax=Paenibacillus sp. 598K TaxID=1117987 RepID=UPI000FFA875C|nr:beta-galactosidase trimerization domain-containing protein [Paenibacillus sp. 598K]GBF76501.1 beta-galactosidase [Paenibacillus sp. 598K]
MRFRQVHLDFHTSEAIASIGAAFKKEQFQHMLKLGHVDSITLFSKCHHGWAYHPSEASEIHPGLRFDLLGAQIEAAHEIGVKTPVYLSGGLDERLARAHPEWLIRDRDDATTWTKGYNEPGYHELCLNSPYLDVLLSQVRETLSRYDADSLFIDIVGVRECYCHTCIEAARIEGKGRRDKEALLAIWERTFAVYTAKVRETVDAIKPGLPVFHNGGHIRRGRRDLARMNSHLELESLPTGGGGYDHFPLSARYAQTLGMDYLGMTGKFHTAWGEFGGYKHPNALRYEAALSLAHGARVSIGDQLHPSGLMDEATYGLIGEAYREVESKQEWCTAVHAIADVALLTLEATGVHARAHIEKGTAAGSDAGAIRILLEGNFLFDVVDLEQDFSVYRVIILPDYVPVGEELRVKLEQYIRRGGKLLATGWSGLDEQGEQFLLDFGVKHEGLNPYRPDYFRPLFQPGKLGKASFVFYSQGQRVSLSGGTELGQREDPYFNRDANRFCSHLHTPNSEAYGGPGMAESASGIYIAWNVFDDYASKGSLILKEAVVFALNRLLPTKTLVTNLPAQGMVTLQEQREHHRIINHLLYVSPVRRGDGIEVIEDIIPLRNIQVSIRTDRAVTSVYLAPQMTPLLYRQDREAVSYSLPELECHQMVVIALADEQWSGSAQ